MEELKMLNKKVIESIAVCGLCGVMAITAVTNSGSTANVSGMMDTPVLQQFYMDMRAIL